MCVLPHLVVRLAHRARCFRGVAREMKAHPTSEQKTNPTCDECRGKTVIGPAIRKGELIFVMKAPARHHDVIKAMVDAGLPAPIGPAQGYEQGFMTRWGFRDRPLTGVMVFGERRQVTSEDLW
jgi:hypothetical protein